MDVEPVVTELGLHVVQPTAPAHRLHTEDPPNTRGPRFATRLDTCAQSRDESVVGVSSDSARSEVARSVPGPTSDPFRGPLAAVDSSGSVVRTGLVQPMTIAIAIRQVFRISRPHQGSEWG